MNFFSSNIKILRKQSGLRQSEIPEHLGFTRTTWSNYENGISQPSIDGLLQIAHFFSISVSDLLEKELSPLPVKKVPRRPKRYSVISLKPTSIFLAGDRDKYLQGNGLWERTTTW